MSRPVPPDSRSERIARGFMAVMLIAALVALAVQGGLAELSFGIAIGAGSFSLGIGLAQRLYR